ncbi:hypothetical protein [Amycolatopsis eburnea]|uniref:Uncharacterized protein n=1 Tax=Amycolatopsis eburnea TaxID=2267691 RepID=A0A3R9E5B1_9PSEU|nr:hypothetical protein [Amycolatopsis eburnea]RSD26448.1 hypothetical protein EIY87_00235 [Amycolatopsis eburnea]
MSDAYTDLSAAWVLGGVPSQGKTAAIRALSLTPGTSVEVVDSKAGLDGGRFAHLEFPVDAEDTARLLEETVHEIGARRRLLAALPRP